MTPLESALTSHLNDIWREIEEYFNTVDMPDEFSEPIHIKEVQERIKQGIVLANNLLTFGSTSEVKARGSMLKDRLTELELELEQRTPSDPEAAFLRSLHFKLTVLIDDAPIDPDSRRLLRLWLGQQLVVRMTIERLRQRWGFIATCLKLEDAEKATDALFLESANTFLRLSEIQSERDPDYTETEFGIELKERFFLPHFAHLHATPVSLRTTSDDIEAMVHGPLAEIAEPADQELAAWYESIKHEFLPTPQTLANVLEIFGCASSDSPIIDLSHQCVAAHIEAGADGIWDWSVLLRLGDDVDQSPIPFGDD